MSVARVHAARFSLARGLPRRRTTPPSQRAEDPTRPSVVFLAFSDVLIREIREIRG
jgi:hypothetical protein